MIWDKSLHEIEHEAWSQRANFYDSLFAPVSTQTIRDILDSLGEIRGKKHLDVACGTGHLVAAASQRGAASEGIDFAETMIDVARNTYPSEVFHVADAKQLPYDDSSFDAVTCAFGLSHMEDPLAAVKEAFRVLKAGGRFAFTLWYGAEDGNTSLAIIKKVIDKHAIGNYKLPKKWVQLRNANRDSCETLTRQVGFSNPDFNKLPIVWRAHSAQEVVDVLMKLSVRTKLVIDQQPATVQEKIFQQILSEAESYRMNGSISLGWPALLTVVQKPKPEKSVTGSSHLEPKHTVFESLEEMLAPETLSQLLSEPVTSVKIHPIEDHGGLADGRLNYVDTDATRLVLKQMSVKHDWIMHTTDDPQCRSVTLWQYGLLDELRPHLERKIIACARDGTGWAILMQDLTGGLFSGRNNQIPPKLVKIFLDRLARLHATFWNDPRLEDPRLGLCDPASRLDITSPELANHQGGDQRGPIPEWVREGWKIMATAMDRDVYQELIRLREDPQPLLKALARYPYTLVHDDYRDVNLAFLKPDQPVAFDWQQATRSLMTLDVAAWFVDGDYVRNAMGKTGAIRFYRERLERYLKLRFPDEDWQVMMDLGNLYHDLFIACLHAYFSIHADTPEQRVFFETDLAERNQQIRDGVRWL